MLRILTLLSVFLSVGFLSSEAFSRNFFKEEKLPIEFSNQDWSLTIKGQYLRDYRWFFDNTADVDSTPVTRAARLPIRLKYKNSSITYVPEFTASHGSAEIFDLYFAHNFNKKLNFGVGKVKAPISLEWYQSLTNLAFNERRYVSYLLPARDIGVYLYGSVLDNSIDYFAGVFYGTTDMNNRNSDVDDNKDFKARLIYKPIEKAGIGFGLTYGKREGIATNDNLPSYRSMGQQRVFTYNTGVVASGENIRFIPQAYWYQNNYGFLAEYGFAQSEVLNLNNNQTAQLNQNAYTIIASYALTGENIDISGKVKPLKKLSLCNGGFGAFILNASISGTHLDESSFSKNIANPNNSIGQADTASIGIKWILNSNVQLKTDLNITEFQAANGAPERETEKALFSRLQITF